MMVKDLMIRSSSAEFLIFERQTHDKGVQVRFEDGDLWLTQKSIGELFDTTRNNITMHINEIYNTYELDEKYGIMTRVGLHCAPSAHKTLGTYPKGTIRFSFGWWNTKEDIDVAIDALDKLTKDK